MLDAEMQRDVTWRANRWIVWVIVILGTVDSFLYVLKRWSRFDSLGHFAAIVFVLVLLTYPCIVFGALKKGRRLPTELLVLFAYLVLLMSINVFAR